MSETKKRSFWVPYNVSYSDYMGEPITNRVNFDAFNEERSDVLRCANEMLYPQAFLYFRDHFETRLEKIAEDCDGNKKAFMKAAIDELSGTLAHGEYLLTEGEAIAIGIELGRYLALFDAVEKFDVIFSKLMGVDE